MTGNDWEARQQDDGTAGRRDYETTRLRDHGTTRLRDHETARPRDRETTGLRDDGTARPRSHETPEKPRRSQAFSVILSRAGLRATTTLPSEMNFCQKGLDVVLSRRLTGWGCTWAYIPIQADEGSAADDPLSQQRTNYLFLNV